MIIHVNHRTAPTIHGDNPTPTTPVETIKYHYSQLDIITNPSNPTPRYTIEDITNALLNHYNTGYHVDNNTITNGTTTIPLSIRDGKLVIGTHIINRLHDILFAISTHKDQP